MVFLGRVLKNVSVEGQRDETEEQDSKEESDKQTKLSLLWMIRRMRKIVNVEIVQAPKSTAVVIDITLAFYSGTVWFGCRIPMLTNVNHFPILSITL